VKTNAEHSPDVGGLEDRRARILDLARVEGFVGIDALAERFKLTPQTIRRDINAMCEAGLLRRYHGGASLVGNSANTAYDLRKRTLQSEKERIGALVAQHIPDGASLFLNIGTTTEAVAAALLGHKDLRIVTNNINVAAMMCQAPDFEVTIAGGRVRNHDLAVVGEAALDAIGQYKVDFGIIGISGIDADGTLLDFDYREVRVAQAIIANARTVYLATDHTKFGRRAMVKLGHLSMLDALFLDRRPTSPYAEALTDAGLAVYVVTPNTD